MAMLKGGKYDGRDTSWVPAEYLETDEGRRAQGLPTKAEEEEAAAAAAAAAGNPEDGDDPNGDDPTDPNPDPEE